MHLFALVLPIALVVLPALGAQAQEACTVSTYTDALRCAEARSPEVQRAFLELEQARSLVGRAAQWQNPELSADSFNGRVGSEKSSETEISLGIPIELGGKISARTAVAQGSVEKTEANLFEVKARVRSTVLLKLHRLRQLLHELEVIDESIGTFSKLVSQYSKRLKLSPEQELSVTVFKMSKSDYDLKKVAAIEELSQLDSYFRILLGTTVEQLKKSVPLTPKTWPNIEPKSDFSNSPRIRLVQADLSTALAELDLAKSESWPTLTIGPSLKLQTEAGQSDQLYGVNVSFPLPLFNLNGHGRAAAASGVKLAETNKYLALTEQEKNREELSRIYLESVKVLGTTLSHQEIEKKHTDIERLFLRGIVPSSLVIEAHRTFVELEKSRNERELKAIEAFLSIQTFDGKTPELL